MDSLIVFTAKYFILIPIIVTAYLIYKSSERHQMLALLLCGGILSVVLAKIASRLYWDPRPFLGGNVTPLFTASRDNGFPSDHTLLGAFLAFVALGYSKKLGWALLVVAVLIGWARVAAGVHHAADIIASFAISGAAYFIVSRLLKMKTQKQHQKVSAKKTKLSGKI